MTTQEQELTRLGPEVVTQRDIQNVATSTMKCTIPIKSRVDKQPYTCPDCGMTCHYEELENTTHDVNRRQVTYYAYLRNSCICEERARAEHDVAMREQRQALRETHRIMTRQTYESRWGLEGDLATYVLKDCPYCKSQYNPSLDPDQRRVDLKPLVVRSDVKGFDLALTAAHILTRDWPAIGLRGFILSGSSHIGKTHIAAGVVHYFVHSAEPVEAALVDSKEMFEKICASMPDASEAIRYYREIPVLAIDELGGESIPPDQKHWMIERFLGIVDKRMLNNRPTIITTNKTGEELKALYEDDRIINRIRRLSEWIPMQGKPWGVK